MAGARYLLGFDVGSSSVKAALVDADSGTPLASAMSPDAELPIKAVRPGWAEQDPEIWWQHAIECARKLRAGGADLDRVEAIGISYQMHGLVVVGDDLRPLRPAIIWCDSRAVEIGARAFQSLGCDFCLDRYLNSPGNFTASKLAWVRENEPELFSKIKAVMLPGDYLALKLTGEVCTTPSGLSEGILWDFKEEALASKLLSHYGIDERLIPEVVQTFGVQGQVTRDAAALLGVPPGAKVSYRAGDQPNNALSLNVLRPGEVAATAGTSGVVYGVSDVPRADPESRVNTFLHVNHAPGTPRYGVLLCINGTGALNGWLRKALSTYRSEGAVPYERLNADAATVTPGAEGLFLFPYGNGAERSLGNRNLGASLEGLELNIHEARHLARATQEGIVYALNYGLEIMKGTGVEVRKVRAGHANMFLSPLFRGVFAAVTGASIELFDTDGAQGAARGAGVGAGIFSSFEQAFAGLLPRATQEPDRELSARYAELYRQWRERLARMLNS